MKFKPAETYEFNAAFGQDSSQASEIRRFPNSQTFYDPGFSGNRNWMANVIYHPRSDLLFSVEYRRLRTFSVNGASEDADHINVAIGVLF